MALISVFETIFIKGFNLVIGILTVSLVRLSEALHSGLNLITAAITFFQSGYLINKRTKNIITDAAKSKTSLSSGAGSNFKHFIKY